MKDANDELLYTGLHINELPRRLDRKDDDPSPLITTFLHISGDDLDPKRCTKAAGLEPTSSNALPATLPGIFLPSGRPNVMKPYWTLEIGSEKSYNIDFSLARLIDLIWPRRERVLKLVRDSLYKASFGSNVTIYEDRPLYLLTGATQRRLAYFSFDYCLDIFDYS
jgi:hypothetical protein